jgi:hypothetical protein
MVQFRVQYNLIIPTSSGVRTTREIRNVEVLCQPDLNAQSRKEILEVLIATHPRASEVHLTAVRLDPDVWINPIPFPNPLEIPASQEDTTSREKEDIGTNREVEGEGKKKLDKVESKFKNKNKKPSRSSKFKNKKPSKSKGEK